MRRTLSLKREALTVLDEGDLAGVGGGDQLLSGVTCPVTDCVALTFPPRCYSFPWC